VPWVTSAPAASSQSGEKPNAAMEPSSTTLPAVFRIARRLALGSYSSAAPGADELDRHAQEVPGRRLVQARAADETRQDELRRLVDAAAHEREDAAHGALGKGEQEGETAGHR